ncbi:hypothetical protein AMATHDRAFT_43362 [Amanita thiersii Skay4041]|uniref:NAD(P)-binding protein n=1 Tax=Amanita thiersii Skay4041 TaxID=703135 RepID=A0A2A9NEW0_9AGAR|nr:hypothetical protein AMATHDRAFT_43362 [Amanita thiersii Skay4041]
MNAIERLKKAGLGPGNGEIIWHKLDLSDPRDAKKSGEEFLKRESRLDILINNAALISAPFEKGPDGVSTMVTINYGEILNPFSAETASFFLPPQSHQPLRIYPNTPYVRIVNVASTVHRWIPLGPTFNTIEDYNLLYKGKILSGLMRYGHSKLMNVLFTRSLQKRFDEATPPVPITVIAAHPGGVDTYSQDWYFSTLGRWLMSSFL